jgi:hypothetical protein
MSTANFITKEELLKLENEKLDEYERIEDSYIPRQREKPLISPLLKFKSLIFVLTLLWTFFYVFFADLSSNIEVVYYTRLNWNKQMILSFDNKPTLPSDLKLFSYSYPGYREGCDCRDPNKTMSALCKSTVFYDKMLLDKCSEEMSSCSCKDILESLSRLISNSPELNDIYLKNIKVESYDTSYLTLFSKQKKDYKCETGFTLFGA